MANPEASVAPKPTGAEALPPTNGEKNIASRMKDATVAKARGAASFFRKKFSGSNQSNESKLRTLASESALVNKAAATRDEKDIDKAAKAFSKELKGINPENFGTPDSEDQQLSAESGKIDASGGRFGKIKARLNARREARRNKKTLTTEATTTPTMETTATNNETSSTDAKANKFRTAKDKFREGWKNRRTKDSSDDTAKNTVDSTSDTEDPKARTDRISKKSQRQQFKLYAKKGGVDGDTAGNILLDKNTENVDKLLLEKKITVDQATELNDKINDVMDRAGKGELKYRGFSKELRTIRKDVEAHSKAGEAKLAGEAKPAEEPKTKIEKTSETKADTSKTSEGPGKEMSHAEVSANIDAILAKNGVELDSPAGKAIVDQLKESPDAAREALTKMQEIQKGAQGLVDAFKGIGVDIDLKRAFQIGLGELTNSLQHSIENATQDTDASDDSESEEVTAKKKLWEILKAMLKAFGTGILITAAVPVATGVGATVLASKGLDGNKN